MYVSIMVLIVNFIPVFMTTLTLVTAHYSNSSSSRLQQLQRTFYETNGRTISYDESPTETTTIASNLLTTTTSSSVQNLTAIRLANEHFLLIRTQYRCRIPRPKLIKIKDFYDVPSKEYLPRCTVLHQCDDESGCCEVGTERCVALTSETVELHFYVIHADIKDGNIGGNFGRTEALTFVNHTRCHCQEINYMPRTKPMPEHWQPRPVHEYKPVFSQETTTQRVQTHTEKDSDTFRINCRCPHPFIARISPVDERCICDCLERDHHCIRVKRGRLKLSAMDARCVRAGDCTEPLCDFGGTYSKHEAMCVVPKHTNNMHKLRLHGRHHHHKHQKPVHWLQERD